ncbi:Peptidase S8 pro-domain [Popillia japonica]|uniref:Peptidase S8 pro-domain n=1 Tax=Popillia japonica TaxID=7064 RepID=A0AAW1NKP0_POPJA
MPLIWRFFLASYSLFLYTLAAEVFSNSFLVKFRRGVELDEADDVARRNGFVNVGPILGSSQEYHFINHDVPTARTKRSIPHVRKLKVEPLVSKFDLHLYTVCKVMG